MDDLGGTPFQETQIDMVSRCQQARSVPGCVESEIISSIPGCVHDVNIDDVSIDVVVQSGFWGYDLFFYFLVNKHSQHSY